MGACPDWYPLIRAARYLGIAPWELMEKPMIWTNWALTAEGAEIEAQASMIPKKAGAR